MTYDARMDMFAALSDHTRRSILEILARNELPATDIYNNFTVSHPAISQHLKVLKEAELVTVKKKAQQRVYKINPKKLSEIEKWIKKLESDWGKRLDRLDDILKKEVK